MRQPGTSTANVVPSQVPRRSLVLARSGHIHLSTFSPEQPTRRAIILTTTRKILQAVVLCVGVGLSDTSLVVVPQPRSEWVAYADVGWRKLGQSAQEPDRRGH